MTIIDTFDNTTEAIINPSQIAPPIQGFPKIAVVTFGERVIDALKEYYGARRIGEMEACVTIPIFQINYKGIDIVLYCTTVGGPATAGLLEEMISKGCEKLVFFGSCGVL